MSLSGWQVDSQGQYYVQSGQWIARYDQNSQATYYQNTQTNQTQWETPANWVQPQTQQPKTAKPVKLPARCLDFSHRAARCQVDPEEAKKAHFRPEGAGEFNIWYGRYVGEMWNEHHNDGPAPYRCDARRDSGFTKATIEGSGTHYFCLYFAKGCCHLGAECGFLHRVPKDTDTRNVDQGHDVFGRDRHRQHNTTMSGVGAIENDCKTLYIGGLNCRRTVIEDELREEFGEWGEIEKLNIIRSRNIAFVCYKNRINCEFAKIAMNSQQLGGHTLMNIRWAYDDPNPKSQLKRLHDSQRQMLNVLEEHAEYGPEVPAAKRLAPSSSDSVTGPYPDTAEQYPEDVEVDSVLKTEESAFQQISTDCDRLDGIFRRMEENNRTESIDDSHSYVIRKADDFAGVARQRKPSTTSDKKLQAPAPQRPKAKSKPALHPGGVLVTAGSESQPAVVDASNPTKDPFRVHA